MSIMKYLACIVVFLLLNSGCAAVFTRFDGKPKVYSGIKADIDFLLSPDSTEERSDVTECCAYSLVASMALLDLPFSFVLDTILLPVALFEIHDREKKERKKDIAPVDTPVGRRKRTAPDKIPVDEP